MEFHALGEEYRHKTDDELLALALERKQLTTEANEALKQELVRRGIKASERIERSHKAGILCLDDAPSAARTATRQEFLRRWYRPIGLAPFVVVVFVTLKFFPNSTSPIPIYFVFASLFWVLVVVGYAFFLTFSLRCPVCGSWFGIGSKCRNCDLPKHRDSDSVTGLSIT
jgi:hypothetical protein